VLSVSSVVKSLSMARNKRPLSRCALLGLILLGTALSQAQEPQLSSEKRSQIEAAVSRFMVSTHAPGVSVAGVENGEYEWAAGFGFADLENNAPASGHTLFRLASISKPLTAAAALQLWERGQLDLDVPVQKYCPAFPQKPWPITIRLLLGHLSGIRFYKSFTSDDPEYGNTKHFDHPIQAGLDFFKNEPLLSPPGREFHYATQDYTVVGCAIEGASGTKYVDFVRNNVLVPAGMDQTRVDDRFAVIPYRARFYHKTDSGRVQNADFLDSSYKIPGGGWLSSAEDMARFEAAILNDKLIKSSTRHLMLTPLKPSDGSEDTYGLGWVVREEEGLMLIGHSGDQPGTSTDLTMAPAQSAGGVVLTNMDNVDAPELAKEIVKVLIGAANAEKK